ncbi:MAG TPA: DUF2937 family protein [Steroidobacteraceae bacterium]|nr:DUF2937 family protein [Steroidobacteraceae bacterium]
MFRGYLRLVVFAACLLAGLQIPGFVDQYAKRVDAHYLEARRSFAGFQQTADRYFSGSVDALISHHASSSDPIFKDEARTISALYARLKSLAAELQALQGPLISRVLHVAFKANRELLNETVAAYSYTVPLNPDAIVWGVAVGLVVSVLLEALLVGGFHLIRRQLLRATSTRTPPPPAVRPLRREPSISSELERRAR